MANQNLIYTFILALFVTACTKENNQTKIQYNMDSIKSIPQVNWDKLAGKKIFFGHQSVGFNIIDGLEAHLKENTNIKIKIIEGNSQSLFDHPVLAHSKNGQNKNPKSKIDDFYKKMESGLGDIVDMAGFKFCYVDFKSGTDVTGVFAYYKQKMTEISLKYPKVTFIHYTVPLTTIQSGPKAFIKKILGKDIGVKNNIVRQQFNTLLVNEFSEQPIFDLAKHESTNPNGEREFVLVNNEKVYSLVSGYSNDGGHLSEIGKKNIGMQFLLFLIKETDAR